MKKEWKKPVITIVAKSSTEENVLSTCKSGPDGSGGGPVGAYPMCYHDWEENWDCNRVDQS